MQNLIKSLGKVTAVIGAQWGDEGKGKAVDMLAEQYDVIVRSCGGANAGHTIVVDGKKHVFHLLPSGCMHKGKQVVLGAGMVIHLPTLLEEIETLSNYGINIIPNLNISSAAHILFDFHKEIDAKLESERSKGEAGEIGTTKRGIGPAYMDKAERTGVRMEMLLESNDKIISVLQEKSDFLSKRFDININLESEKKQILNAKKIISSCIIKNAPMFLYESNKAGKSILIEGAQATLLDIDHGTYPFVTSSATSLAGALQGAGIAPKLLTSSIGVAKAYCTRVGSGEFPAELNNEIGERLRERGGEYGATTGRPRRCGWLNMEDLKFAAAINGFTAWNITKLDVLDEEKEINICIGKFGLEKPQFRSFDGWLKNTAHIKTFEELPENAKKYIQFIEEQTGIPVLFIGTGQGREDMIVRS